MLFTRRRLIMGAFALPAAGLALWTRDAAAESGSIYAEEGVAVDGSDVVAYFTKGAPVAGSPDIAHEWMGVTWRFETPENRAAFVADPVSFAPQYGGFCAYAVSRGYTASTVPQAWRIVDGRLYLNFSPRIQRKWEKDIPGNIAAGDENWPGLIG